METQGPSYLDVQIADAKVSPTLSGYDPKRDYSELDAIHISLRGRSSWCPSLVVNLLKSLSLAQRAALNAYVAEKTGMNIPTYFQGSIKCDKVATIVGALALGPLMFDAFLLEKALSGWRTDETLVIELMLDRTAGDLALLRAAYEEATARSLLDAIKERVSGKLETLLVVAASNRRAADASVDSALVAGDVARLRVAAAAREELPFLKVFVKRSPIHLIAVASLFKKKESRSLSKATKKAFSGGFLEALLFILRGAKHGGDGVQRDAKLLEQTMAGLGTRNAALVYRAVRVHWRAARLARVKEAYRKKYGWSLAERVQGDTSGPYRESVLMLLG